MIAANSPVAIAIRSTVAHFMVVDGPYASRNPIFCVAENWLVHELTGGRQHEEMGGGVCRLAMEVPPDNSETMIPMIPRDFLKENWRATGLGMAVGQAIQQYKD